MENTKEPHFSKELRDDLATVDAKGDVINVARTIGIGTPAAIEFLRNAMANALLMERKQLDYGPENIADFGAFGCIVRMNDKMKRMKHLYQNRRKKAQNESIIDSWRDFSNYGIIGQMCETNKWPDV